MAVCSPTILERGAGIQSPVDLEHMTLLCAQPSNDHWSDFLRKSGLDPETIGKRRVIEDANVRLKSTIDGLGFALSHPPLIKPELDERKLVVPFTERLEGFGYHLLSQSAEMKNPAAKKFKDWVLREARVFSREHRLGTAA